MNDLDELIKEYLKSLENFERVSLKGRVESIIFWRKSMQYWKKRIDETIQGGL